MPEPKDGRLVRDGVFPQIPSREPPHRFAVVDGVLRLRVRHVEPQLQQVDPQHLLQSQRLPPLTGLRAERLDQRPEPIPRNARVHLREEPFAPRRFALVLPRQSGECVLFSHASLARSAFSAVSGTTAFSTASPYRTCAELP